MAAGAAFRMSQWPRWFSRSCSLARRRTSAVRRRQISNTCSRTWATGLRNSLRLFLGFLGLRHLRLHDDPTHSELLSVDDFNRQIAEGRTIAGSDFAAEPRRDVAADCLLRRFADIDLQPVREIFDEIVPADAIPSVAERLDLRPFAIKLILNQSEQLFGDVLERDDSGCAAVLIEHHRHMCLVLDELRQQLFHRAVLRNEQHVALELRQRTPRAAQLCEKQVFDVNMSYRLIQRLRAQWIACMSRRSEHRQM